MSLQGFVTLKSLLVVYSNTSKAVVDFSIPVLHKNHRQVSRESGGFRMNERMARHGI